MSTSLTPKSIVCNKIPPFDKTNFSNWKSKAMEALEFMDFDILDVFNKGPIAAMHQSSNDGASNSMIKGKFVPGYNKEEKRMMNLDIKENSLDDEGKCLMDKTVEYHADISADSIGILDANLPHTAKDLKSEWDDTSTYQNSPINGIVERRNKTLSKAGTTMVIEVGFLLSCWAEATKRKETEHLLFSCVCYILNQRDQCSKFEAKADEGEFIGYSSVSRAFRVFNLSRKIVEETTHVSFDEESFIHDRVGHSSLILNKLTYGPSDPVPEFLPSDTEPVVPNVDKLISSQLISED
uniref:Retroviral polymerase SH3-like domain-containing protein n=1 Tax=Lactuca sativa TaxID=4236 RepID=A0A9R1VJL1_LACSA|nr:hypothetical protein LSAT_V11C500277770 [Lactuca sativa]